MKAAPTIIQQKDLNLNQKHHLELNKSLLSDFVFDSAL